MEGKWGRALLAAGAMGAGAYALLREEDDRKRDIEALDGALGGWLSWAVAKAEQVVGNGRELDGTAGSVQMESVTKVTEPSVEEAPRAPDSASRRQAVGDGGKAETRAERRGYAYTVLIEPAPAGSAVRWRLQIKSVAGMTRSGVASARSNQEARVAKLMGG